MFQSHNRDSVVENLSHTIHRKRRRCVSISQSRFCGGKLRKYKPGKVGLEEFQSHNRDSVVENNINADLTSAVDVFQSHNRDSVVENDGGIL